MKQLVALFPFACLPLLASAQCNSPVPSSATVIDADGSYAIFGAQWVCDGVTATLSSGFVNAFVEGNATITASTNLGVYSVRANSTLTISGLNNNIYYDPGATIIDNGTNTMFTACPGLAFDYTDAPANGCTSMNVAAPTGIDAVLFPNPAHDFVNIAAMNGTVLSISLTDMSGRTVRRFAKDNATLHLGGVEPGRYVLAVHSSTGVAVHRLVVQ